MKNTIIKYFLCLTIIVYSTLTLATPSKLIECSSCNSRINFENIAKYTGSSSSVSTTDIFVANFNSATLYKFRITNIPSFEPGVPDVTQSTELTVSSTELGFFSNAVSAKIAIKAYGSENTNVPSDIATSAYQLAGASYKVNAVSDWFVNNAAYTTQVASFLVNVGQMVNVISIAPFKFKLEFSDDSTIVFEGNLSYGEPSSLKIVKMTDKDGNVIPLTANGYKSGQFDFTQQGDAGVQNFIDAAARFGVIISNGGTTDGLATSCTKTAEGRYLCIIISN